MEDFVSTSSDVTSVTSPVNQNETGGSGNGFVEDEIGAIVGLIFGLLFSGALILAAYITYRRHRARNEEYKREMKVFQNSKRNAGVYMDTTVETPPMKIRGGSKDAVYASLRQPELYEPDSDEEF